MELPARLRFRPAMRIRRTRDFDRVYRQGSRARGELMTVAVVPNELPTTRLGLSIGKRVWKGAVQRNRVRRVFREAFRLEFAQLPTGVDLVMIGSIPAITPELEATRRELVRLAAKAHRRVLEKRAKAPAGEAGGEAPTPASTPPPTRENAP